MVLQNLQKIIAFSSLLLMTTSAFSARKSSQLVRSSSMPSRSFAALNAGAVGFVDESNNDEQDGVDVFLMNRATDCANSETCSLEEAQAYLEDVLLMQKDCLDATLQDINPLCENVDVVAEVVADLRGKVESERSRLAPVRATVNAVNVLVGAYVVATLLHGFAAVPNVPVDAPLFAGFDAWDAAGVNDRGVTGVLPQEWYWAVRDGYFPALFSEWFRNGGLVVDVSAFDSKAVAFTPQEWVWSIQNGSFGSLFRENLRYGGYLVDSTFDTEGMTPMTNQDVLWSVQGGYFGTAMKHFFRNGGV